MSPSTHRSVCSLLLAVGTASTAMWALPAHAMANTEPANSLAENPSGFLSRVSLLMADGELVRAHALLNRLQRSPLAATMGDEDANRAWQLQASIERQIAQADRTDISLQKARLGLSEDDLVTATRQANAVIRSNQADAAQVEAARAMLGLIEARRTSIAAKIPAAIEQAESDFGSASYAAAKNTLERVIRSGVELTDEQQTTVSGLRSRIVELELARGSSFATASLGMLAPESGMSTEWLTASTQPADEPGSRGSGTYVGDEPVPSYAEPIEVELTEVPAENDAPETVVSQPGDVDLIEAARRFEAQTLLGEANRAFEERQLSLALQKYNRALGEFSSYLSAEQLEQARNRRSDIQVSLGSQGGPDDALTDTVEGRALAIQRAEATFANQMGQANAALEQGDTARARNLAAQARLTVQQARDVMAESAYEGKLAQVDSLLSEINETEETIRIAEQEQRDAELAALTAELEAERRSERDEKIIAAIERVQSLQMELKYEEALEVVDQILFLDPINPTGLLLKSIIEDTIIYRQYLDLQRDKRIGYAEEFIRNEEAMLINEALVDYPEDWPAISFRRGEPLEFAESEADRQVLATLRNTRLSVEFDDNALEDVVAFIGTNTRLDVDVDWESLADIGVDPDSPVNLRLASGVPVETVLDRVVAKVSDPDLPAGWAIQDGIVTIASDEILRRNTVLEIYDIRDLLFVVPRFEDPPEFDLSSALQSSQGGGGSSPFQSSNNDDDELDLEDRVTEIVDLIQSNVDPDGWVDLGGDTSSITQLNGNFVITTTPRNHRSIIGLLSKLRAVRALQINVEARFLTVSQDFFEQIGFDLDVYFNADNTEFTRANVVDPSLLPSDFFGVNGELLDNVSGGGIFPIDTDGDTITDALGPINQPVFGPGNNGGVGLPNDQWSIIGGRQNSFGLTETLAGASGFAADILLANPALGVTGRFLDDVQVDFLVEATQADQRSVILTAPRLTFTNGQRAYITVATSTTFVSDLTPITSDSAVAFDPTITPLPTGVILDVEGVVSADRRYVTMTVRTSISEAEFDSDRDVSLVGGAGGGGGVGGVGGGGALAEGTIQVPVVTATEVRTTVTVPDQGTVLLGGQRIVEELEVETGVPVLSKIPILSRFFSNRIDVKEEQTLLVLIKPTILIQNEEEERQFPGLLDQLGG